MVLGQVQLDQVPQAFEEAEIGYLGPHLAQGVAAESRARRQALLSFCDTRLWMPLCARRGRAQGLTAGPG